MLYRNEVKLPYNHNRSVEKFYTEYRRVEENENEFFNFIGRVKCDFYLRLNPNSERNQ